MEIRDKKSKNYFNIFLFVEIQLILILLVFLSINTFDLNEKLKRTNVFINGIFLDKKTNSLQEIKNNDIVIGEKNAPVTVIMYTKYDCSACSEFFETTYPQVKKNYIDRGLVKFVVRFMTNKNQLVPFYALKSAQYAFEHNFYESFDNQIHQSNFSQLDTLKIRELVLSLDTMHSTFDSFMKVQNTATKLIEKAKAAREAGINKTPAFLINGELHFGSRKFEKFEEWLLQKINEPVCE